KYAILEDDYPSLNYAIQSRGFAFELIGVHKGNLEEHILKVIKNSKPDVLSLSIVQYISGLKIDLAFIKQLKQDNPNLIIIGDATQYLGTEPFDFIASGFDAVAGSGYKWLMAGFGNGYMMLSGELHSMLYTAARQRPGPKEPMLADKPIVDLYFEPGHQDTLSHGTLSQSVHFYKELNMNNIKEYLNELKDYAYQIFDERGWLLPVVKGSATKSLLINLQVPRETYPLLVEKGVRCFPRGSGIRIGLHLYNDKSDVDRLVTVLDQAL
ncbi:MAG: aminotransferase class V-fold PLP-dependent enzyme, partial [Pedobacter sp.]